MTIDPTRRKLLAGSATAGIIAVAGCTGGDDDPADDDSESETDDEPMDEDESTDDESVDEDGDDESDAEDAGQYEIWALDQGMDTIHLYEPGDGDDEFDHVEAIDLNALEGVPDDAVTPHMIDFSSDYEYAAVACTAGARTLIFRTEDAELVGNVETGASSHMAAFDPENEHIHVDVIAESKIVRVDADLENEEFEYADYIELPEDETVQEAGIDSANPICHQFDSQGRSIHTLGPSYHDAGLVIVDHDEFTVELAYSKDEIPTNCGTMPHPEEDKFYLTAGLPSDSEAGEEGVGDFYVYDTAEDELTEESPRSTEGIDAHGFWYTPDGEELWVLNRESNDGVIIDPETDEVIEEIDQYIPGDNEKPDIMWSSPDGEYMFVTSRGPDPQSAAHVATGDTPGFAVLDIETREIVTVVEPDPVDEHDLETDGPSPDFHGIGVRPIDDFETDIPTSPPF